MKPVKWIILLCLLFNPALSVFSSSLPITVQQALKQVGIPESAVGIYVQEIGTKHPMLAVNATQAMNPASVMKLVTTFAGLELLGPAYSWQTELYTHGLLENGVLQGDLIIKGYGDPKLNMENFWLLIHQLRQTGLRKITGNLVLDHSHFELPEDDPGAFDGKPYRTYNMLPEALLVNYRTTALHFMPQPENNAVRVIIDPMPDSLLLSNNLKLTQGHCGDWQSLLGINIQVDNEADSAITIHLNGQYSVDCAKKSYHLGLQDSSSYIGDLFKRLWRQQGGVFQGRVVEGAVPPEASLIETYQSPPLTEIIRGINKFSNNLAARQLYLTIGAEKSLDQTSATLEKSSLAIKQWLTLKQLYIPELIIENGAGLSRKSRISAQHMGALLLAAFQSPVMPEFLSSLPIAAVDGTMKRHFQDTAVSGLAHIKTGSLNEVRTMAGYMLDKSGKRLVVVFFVNHTNAPLAQTPMGALLQSLYSKP